MKVRPANPEDYDGLLDLLMQLNPEDAPPAGMEKQAFEEILASENLQLMVAEVEGNLVASCYLNIIPNMTRNGRPYAVIENVITDQEHRKRGIGKAILDRAVETAKWAGCYKVMLMSGRSDESVHHFYRGCGFDGDAKQAYIIRF